MKTVYVFLKGLIIMLYAILLFILSEVTHCTVASNEFAADLFLTLKYSNPKNLLEKGSRCDFWINKCDVYFEVCVSSNGNRGCDLLKRKTSVFTGWTQVELKNDGRIVIPLRTPLPRSLKIEVVAWDHDKVSGDDLIGDFSIAGSLQYLLQGNRELRPRRACSSSMSIELELICGKNWFGKVCETYCNPVNQSFTCDENGKAICSPGYFGQSCTHKNYCYAKPCAENAQCENTGTGFKCIFNGKEDAKCYANYKPCLNETCSEHGVCKPSPESTDGFECECERRWRGKRCELHVDACEFEENRLQELDAGEPAICLNNGTCVSDPNGLDFHCQCPPPWEGIRCEKRTQRVLIISISSSVALSVCLICCFILLRKKVSARNRYRRGGFVYTTEGEKGTAIMPTGENDVNHGQPSIHLYADIGDPYVLPETNGRSTADDFAPPQPAEQNSASESPPDIPARTAI